MVAQRGRATFELCDWTVWNAIHLSRANFPYFAKPSESDDVRAEVRYVPPQTRPSVELPASSQRCRRQIRPLVYLSDFET